MATFLTKTSTVVCKMQVSEFFFRLQASKVMDFKNIGDFL